MWLQEKSPTPEKLFKTELFRERISKPSKQLARVRQALFFKTAASVPAARRLPGENGRHFHTTLVW